MIEGTGPGRGRWWPHSVLFLTFRYRGNPEPAGRPREGRTVAVIRKAATP